MIKLENVVKNYDSVTALDEVSLELHQGEIVGLLGANGAGKTTLIHIIMNYINPDQGKVDWGRTEQLERKEMKTGGITYVPDEPVFYDFMTVEEQMRFIYGMYASPEYSVEELVRWFDLEAHVRKLPHMLSKGNKQKVMISLALLREFDYMIADEPFSGLDPRQAVQLKNKFLELKNRKKGVLISSHRLLTLDLICDRYIILNKGQIIAQGTKNEIIEANHFGKDVSMEDVYIALCGGIENEDE